MTCRQLTSKSITFLDYVTDRPSPFNNQSAVNKILFASLVSILFVVSIHAQATYDAVIDFGFSGTTEMVGTINQFATADASNQTATNLVLNTTAATATDSGLRFSTSGGIFSAGGTGTFSPAGNVNYAGGSAVVDGWIDNEQVAYGDIWQGVANAELSNQTVSLIFAGLAAQTRYTFTLLSGRANNFGAVTSGTYGLTYATANVAGGGTHDMGGGANGFNATQYTWSFSTGATAGEARIGLVGGWNVNAVVITAVSIPEPASAAALLGLGGLALVLSRRQRSV